MRHAGGQLADRGEFFGLIEHLLALFQFRYLCLDPRLQLLGELAVTGFGFEQAGMRAFQRLEIFSHRFKMQR